MRAIKDVLNTYRLGQDCMKAYVLMRLKISIRIIASGRMWYLPTPLGVKCMYVYKYDKNR